MVIFLFCLVGQHEPVKMAQLGLVVVIFRFAADHGVTAVTNTLLTIPGCDVTLIDDIIRSYKGNPAVWQLKLLLYMYVPYTNVAMVRSSSYQIRL